MNKKEDLITRTINTYEDLAEDYSDAHLDIRVIQDIADYFVENLPGEKVLDIGCGPGRDAKYFSDKGLDVTGIDLTANFVKIASKNAPRAKFLKMDMRKLTFPEETFDGIWACASFLHVPKEDARQTLLGFRRVLKTGSLLYISVKEGKDEKILKKDEYKGRVKFFSFYKQEDFTDLVESCNFYVKKVLLDAKKDTYINLFATK